MKLEDIIKVLEEFEIEPTYENIAIYAVEILARHSYKAIPTESRHEATGF